MNEIPTTQEGGTVSDAINPQHYQSSNGIECYDVAKFLPFGLGNALKYVWRAGLKPETTFVEDLTKALWYLERHRVVQCTDIDLIDGSELLCSLVVSALDRERASLACSVVRSRFSDLSLTSAKAQIQRAIDAAGSKS